MITIDFIKILEIIKMAGITVSLIITIFFTFCIRQVFDDWGEKIVRPWEKAERREARRREKEKAKERERWLLDSSK